MTAAMDALEQEQLPGRELRYQREAEQFQRAFGAIIWDALKDDGVGDIFINPDGRVLVRRHGVREFVQLDVHVTADHAEKIVRAIVNHVGIKLNPDAGPPVRRFHCRLPFDGSRVFASLPPVTPQCQVTLRKLTKAKRTLGHFVKDGIMSRDQAQALVENFCVLDGASTVLIAGATGSGKTVLANALLMELSRQVYKLKRIVTIEDVPELFVDALNVLPMYTDLPHVDMSMLVQDAMRADPDRIVIGEVRGPEALPALMAFNTGHPGLLTVHANSAPQALMRLQTMAALGVPGQNAAVSPRLVAEAIQVVAYIEKLKTGQRRVREIIRVTGVDRAGNYTWEPLEPIVRA